MNRGTGAFPVPVVRERAVLPNRWYPILESRRLRRRPVGVERLGRRLVLWRGAGGRAVAMPSQCPHRGAGLHLGRVRDGELACPWHGFRFDASGHCVAMPCEGAEARVPKALDLPVYPVEEAHGLVWMWWGDRAASRPPIPWFEELVGGERRTSETSYELPYHYTRMVETNLDIHHTPFVHGLMRMGTRVDPFEARVEGDRVVTTGELRREGASSGYPFRVEALLPCLVRIVLSPKLCLAVSSTPVDDDRTWLWFRYYQDYTSVPGLRTLIPWLAVQLELRVVQPQDWRIFASLVEGRIDEVPYRFVRADQGIALYRKLRGDALAAAARSEAS